MPSAEGRFTTWSSRPPCVLPRGDRAGCSDARAACGACDRELALVDGEDVAFFGPGVRVTIGADATVGDTIRDHGPVGSGVIVGRVSPSLPRADHGAPVTVAGQVRGHRVATVPTSPNRCDVSVIASVAARETMERAAAR